LLDLCIGKIVSPFLHICKNLFHVMCTIGPYKSTSFPTGTKTTKPLYTESYILVVRKRNVSFEEYLAIPFAPFQKEVILYSIHYIISIRKINNDTFVNLISLGFW